VAVDLTTDMRERLDEIQNAVEHASGCIAVHKESVPVVIKESDDRLVWEGLVEVFGLEGHPKAKCAFGWQSGDRSLAALKIPPINSAEDAVRAALLSNPQNM
jgi:hypothetical protein